MTSPPNKSSARERILETAGRLFYAEGVRAVGIDRIIAEAGVAKMTLYNHFKSKDELVVAVLKERDIFILNFFEQAMKKHQAAGADALDAFFGALKDWFETPNFRGCAFINAAIELADCDHPGTRIVLQHKEVFQERIRQALEKTAGESGAAMAPAIAVLVEGAIVSAQLKGEASAADLARGAARSILEGAAST